MPGHAPEPHDHPLLQNLNAPQREAVCHARGPLLILAGAGSGKTTVITRRIAWLIEEEGVQPGSILAMTFTNKAAEEMRERVQRLVSVPAAQMWVSTFHSFCTRILRREGDRTPVGRDFVIFDPSDQKSLVKQVLAELKLPEKQFHPKKVLELISDFKNRCLLPEEAREEALDPWTRKVLDAYDLYQKGLKNHRACDFDDLLLWTERLFRDPVVQMQYAERFKFILVDEYQDTNRAQYLLVQHLARRHHNICVVGDEDQCLAKGTRIRMADGRERPIEKLAPGDLVLAGHGSGDFRPATVLKASMRSRDGLGVRITTESGHVLVSTPEHIHFAGYRLGATPQLHFVYLMHKQGVGWRLGTSQTHTRGQVKPVVGFLQRARQEHADDLWVLSTHGSEQEARIQEEIWSLRYQLPTLPFVPCKGGSTRGLVHDAQAIRQVFGSVDSQAGAERLLADLGMAVEAPHHRAQASTGKRRQVVVTLCGDRRGKRPMHRLSMVGQSPEDRRILEGLGLSVRPAKAGSRSWRVETCAASFSTIRKMADRIRKHLEADLQLRARLGASPGRESSSLPFLPACNLKPGMALFDGQGGLEVVAKVERVPLKAEVFDLDIEGVHNFIANGCLTHNSIYGWRGADIRNILDFQQDFPEAMRIELLQNYRSTEKILDAASQVISNNSQRVEGKGALKTDLGEGESIIFKLSDEGRLEAEWVVQRIQELRYQEPEAKIAVLYRANWQSRQMEEALRAQNLAYRLVGGVKFYERQEVKDLISYLRLISNPFDLVSFRRCVNAPTRGVGPTTLGKIEGAIPEGGTPLEGLAVLLRSGELKGRAQREMGKFLDLFQRAAGEREAQGLAGLVKWVLQESGYLQSLEDEATLEAEGRIRNLEEFLSAAAEMESLGLRLSEFLDRITLAADTDQIEEAAHLSLMTIHCAKGLEFPFVFVVGMEEDVFPNRNARETPEGLEEERRLFYVAITRAQRRLTLSAARRRRIMGTEMLGMPSRFLREIPSEALTAPIRWGTVIYQAGEGVRPGNSFSRGGGGASVATELQRIRSFFDRVKEPSAPAAADTPQRLEPTEPQDASAFPAGTRVRSARFGLGSILAASGRGDGLTYTVRFDQGGDKRIMARFGGLERA
ncbi:UvrD-helicase domain-containing protein [Geothrix sp. PMB-07]|uniref:UvrD-helicase domain-containing protein n=1 Tax=Geothrix sp. PMB-07 TaxID=3068640 RepID=UPI00274297BF|nr:UvrD-helicase domain-containing protein [Geothrix sp. PMB-07]WLT30481.1 UvrD-helicase domain-containing protein [Geothrix sp. PMB-07]